MYKILSSENRSFSDSSAESAILCVEGSPCIKDIERHRQYLSCYVGAFRNFQVELSVRIVGAISLLPPRVITKQQVGVVQVYILWNLNKCQHLIIPIPLFFITLLRYNSHTHKVHPLKSVRLRDF